MLKKKKKQGKHNSRYSTHRHSEEGQNWSFVGIHVFSPIWRENILVGLGRKHPTHQFSFHKPTQPNSNTPINFIHFPFSLLFFPSSQKPTQLNGPYSTLKSNQVTIFMSTFISNVSPFAFKETLKLLIYLSPILSSVSLPFEDGVFEI